MSPIIVALDFPTLDEARALATSLGPEVAGFKVGLELITGVGPAAIEEIAALGRPIFADLKLHDIPNTVEGAARRIAAAGARWITVHASGGLDMLRAARSGMGEGGVLAVTVLTSLDDGALADVGVETGVLDQVLRLARVAEAAGVEGAVCSPVEVAAVKQAHPGLTVFTPGVRPQGANADDQRRISTPDQAIASGADYVVIGRPITRAPDPIAAAREIASSIARVGT
jgi:orotidine-5'-phosphate decarboxylase